MMPGSYRSTTSRSPLLFAVWWACSAGIGWCHGTDTYNLLVKLFVEEYQTRFLRTIESNGIQWSAYPLDSRYASFEDLYYNYLYYLKNPQATLFPSPRNPQPYKDNWAFIVFHKSEPEPLTQIESQIPNRLDSFSLTIGNNPPDHPTQILDDPIHEYPILSETRRYSFLILIKNNLIQHPLTPNKEVKITLSILNSDTHEPIRIEWIYPHEFPIHNNKYESDIWTVVRERYATMPQPTHPPGQQIYLGPPNPRK